MDQIRAVDGVQNLAVRHIHDPDLVGPAISDIKLAVRSDAESVWLAEMRPLIEKLSFLIEDLNPAVFTVRDEHAATRVDRYAMRKVELARTAAFGTPGLEK